MLFLPRPAADGDGFGEFEEERGALDIGMDEFELCVDVYAEVAAKRRGVYPPAVAALQHRERCRQARACGFDRDDVPRAAVIQVNRGGFSEVIINVSV